MNEPYLQRLIDYAKVNKVLGSANFALPCPPDTIIELSCIDTG